MFGAGDVVYAWWWDAKKQNRKFKATVEKVNEDGAYDIVYQDDGTRRERRRTAKSPLLRHVK